MKEDNLNILKPEQRKAIAAAVLAHPLCGEQPPANVDLRKLQSEIKTALDVVIHTDTLRRVLHGGQLPYEKPVSHAPQQARAIKALFQLMGLDLSSFLTEAAAPTFETQPHLFFPDVESFAELRRTRISDCMKLGPIRHLINYCHLAKQKKWKGHEIDKLRFLEAAEQSRQLMERDAAKDAVQPTLPILNTPAKTIEVTVEAAGFSISKVKAAIAALKEANLYTPEMKVGILRELGLE